jgi:nucleotide-binding universal stress UspA family protein
MRKEEKERLEREEMEAKGFVSRLERLLVAVDDSPNGQFGSRLAGLIAGTRAMPTTVMHITARKKSKVDAAKESEKADKARERAEAAAQLLQEAAEQMNRRRRKSDEPGRPLDVKIIADATPEKDLVAEEAEKGYDLLVVGLDKTTVRDNTGFHPNITQLASAFDGPLVIADARDGLLENPRDGKLSILVPVNGTEPSRRAAEVAFAMARATRAPVTVLYVAPPAVSGAKKRSRRMAEAMLKDIVALGESYDVDVKTAVRTETMADEAVLKEVAKRRHNLIVMGVERRPGEKLFFGETATAILEKSDRSIVFVVS